ncbi:MAG: hypothetical protein ACLU6F_03710, partial [[Ruminococcus] torques]
NREWNGNVIQGGVCLKDIKEKVRDKNPKIRNPASRLPKELVRSAMLETKEKSRMVADKVGRETGEESPVEYAGNRIERAEQRAGKESASVAYHGGKKLAVKTYEKIKEQRQREAVIATLDSETGSGGTSGQTRTKKGRTGAGRSIKIKPEAEKTVKEAGNRTVKTAPRMVKASPVSSQKVKTQAILQKKAGIPIHEGSQGSKTGCHALCPDSQAKQKDSTGNSKRDKSYGRSSVPCSKGSVCSVDGRRRHRICDLDPHCGDHWRCLRLSGVPRASRAAECRSPTIPRRSSGMPGNLESRNMSLSSRRS